MMEMSPLSDTCTSSDPPGDPNSTLLPTPTLADTRVKEDEIDSTAKSKTHPLKGICYSINNCLLLVLGVILVVTAVLLFIWPLFDLLTTQRRRMLPGLPPFELWRNPEPIVYCKVHIFTVTNAEDFLSGTDKKMRVKEVGPIVYREILSHTDVVFHENSTLSYTMQRRLEFLPDMNEPGILNRTLTVPNIVLLGMVSQVPEMVSMVFNLISKEDKVIVNKTVYEYLWDFTTPALLTVDKYLPFIVPQNNGGTLYSIYKDFTDRVNVRIGPKYNAQEFFTINTYQYRPTVPGFRPERGDCFASLMNASEGAIYPNRVGKDAILYYWRKTVCRPVPLYFKEEVMVGSLLGYKYITHDDWYDREKNLTADCYKGFYKTPLPDGLSDVSKCYNGLPIAVSSPHFYSRSGYWTNKVEGYTPNREEHYSYTIVEPINGVPLQQVARSQSNIILPRLRKFGPDINKFSEMVVPMTWLEYYQPELTPSITRLLIFTSNILPRIEYVIPVIFLVLGILMHALVIRRMNRDFSLGGYSRVKILWQREKESFFDRKTVSS